ncbi:hypothetical protein ACSNOI_16720 [Actinomadura kijaniata]|uniref:hypothetical protein n=1 Tax=Actinomadura kijaniata TaxID=46161 RepID=UPI003F1B9932
MTGYAQARAVPVGSRSSVRYELAHLPYGSFGRLPPAPVGDISAIDPPEHARYRRLLAERERFQRHAAVGILGTDVTSEDSCRAWTALAERIGPLVPVRRAAPAKDLTDEEITGLGVFLLGAVKGPLCYLGIGPCWRTSGSTERHDLPARRQPRPRHAERAARRRRLRVALRPVVESGDVPMRDEYANVYGLYRFPVAW